MAKSFAFAQFKSDQGLSHQDICDLFQISPEESKNWVNGATPPQIDKIAIILNGVLDRQKLIIESNSGQKTIQTLEKDNSLLKIRVEKLTKLVYKYDKAAKAKKAIPTLTKEA